MTTTDDYAPSRRDDRGSRLQRHRRRLGRGLRRRRPDRTRSASSSTWVRSTRRPTACCAWSLELEGETVTDVRAVIGYLHTGIEKNTEFRTWTQGVTFLTRADYLAPLFNETAYCLGVEKLLGVEVPRARAADPRADDGDQPDLLALGLAGHRRHGARRAHRDDQRLPRPRAVPGHLRADHRPADEPRVHPSRRRRAGPARRRDREDPRLDRRDAQGDSPASTSCCAASRSGSTGSRTSAGSASRAASRSASPARCCAPPACRGTCARPSRTSATRPSTSRCRPTTRGDCWSRFLVRVAEMRESLKIVEQVLDRLEPGPVVGRRPEDRLAGASSRSARTAWATRSSTCRRSWARRWSR